MPEAKDKAEAPKAEATPEATTAEAPKKQEKTPIPEGFVAPVEFAKLVDKHLNQADGTTKPQIIYGYVKNSPSFPSQERVGFPRFIVNLQEGLKWIDEKRKAKAEKATKETAATEAPKAS